MRSTSLGIKFSRILSKPRDFMAGTELRDRARMIFGENITHRQSLAWINERNLTRKNPDATNRQLIFNTLELLSAGPARQGTLDGLYMKLCNGDYFKWDMGRLKSSLSASYTFLVFLELNFPVKTDIAANDNLKLNLFSDIPKLTDDDIRGLDEDGIQNLHFLQIERLEPKQIPLFTTGQISAFLPWQIKRMEDKIRMFRPDQIEALTPEQIRILTPAQIKAMGVEQIKGLTPPQINAFEIHQIQEFTLQQLGSFTLSQISALHSDKFRNLSFEQKETLLNALTPEEHSLLIRQRTMELESY